MSVFALRALGIGDLATAVPALRGLRAHLPGERIALGVPEWLAPLVPLVGAVDAVVPTPGLDGRPPPVAPPRLAVNLHGRGPQSHALLRSMRPGRLLAFANAGAGFGDGPAWRADEHEVARWCRMLSWYGIACAPGDLSLPVPAAAPAVAGATVLHPGAKSPARRWPPERFAAVAAELECAGRHVVVSGSAGDAGLAARVAAAAGLPPERVLAGRTDVLGLAALVAAARLVISGDTGIAHLATAFGTPSVVLFGPVSPALWGPPADRTRHRALWHGSRAGTVDGVDAALHAIGVSEVLDAAGAVAHGTAVPGK